MGLNSGITKEERRATIKLLKGYVAQIEKLPYYEKLKDQADRLRKTVRELESV